MSFQKQQPPYSYGNAFPPTQMLTAAGTVTSPSDPYNRFLPVNGQHQNGPPVSMPPPSAVQKASLIPPQQHPLRQQVLTNGSGVPGGSANSSRTASPAFNQQINAAYLPPPSTLSPATTSTTPAAATQPLPPSSQSFNQNPFYPPSTSSNSHQPPLTNGVGHSSVSSLTANLQNINLTNGQIVSSTSAAPINQQASAATVNHVFNGTSAFPPNLAPSEAPPVSSPGSTHTSTPGSFVSHEQPPQTFAHSPTSTSNVQHRPAFNGAPPQANQPRPPAGQNLPPTAAINQYPPVQNMPTTSQHQQQLYINSNQFKQPPLPNQPAYNQSLNNNQPPMPTTAFPPQPNPLQQQQQMPPQSTTIGKRPLYPTQSQPINQQPPHSNHYGNGPVAYQQQAHQPQLQYNQYANNQQYQQQQQFSGGGVVQQGFNKLWGQETIDLMQNRHILPPTPIEPPPIQLNHQFFESVNCNPDILRCTLTKIPDSNSLLQKSRLPLGILIHPFRDLNNLPVIQCSTIVRCRSCRSYINPFVYFVDDKKWKCNLCFRVNELPEEFHYDPVSKTYGDVTRRPEVKSSTIEFIAPSEYMLRPPQPAIYLFLLDVSLIAQQSGYLKAVCESLAEHLDALPGDARTQVGFIAYNSAVHFYTIAEGFNRPHEITVVDIEDAFLPCPDNLLINLKEYKELIKDLLTQLPLRFAQSHDNSSALGAALQVAFKLMQLSGGRVTVFQTCLPNKGPGALQSRENPNERSAKDVHHLGPATDFYKRHALECSGQQIAVDLFLLNSQYSDLSTLSGISKFSGGCIHHFPLFNGNRPNQVDSFKRCFERYLTRKIGFESVMRVRCTRGLTIHTFHGNFFVRSTDLLSLPNVNPDAGFGMQISYEENLGDSKSVCFQAALLYTSSKGERRIRVHTLCLPVTNSLTEVIYSADSQAIIALISKMAVDRSVSSSISDARDAFINASCDVFSAFRVAQNLPQAGGQLVAPMNLRLLPLYMLALLKHTAFRTGTSTRLDDRVFAMCELKTLPVDQLIRYIYPDLYHLDCLFENNNADDQDSEKYAPPLLQLSAEVLKSRSIFLMDCGNRIMILVGLQVPIPILQSVFGISAVNDIPDMCYDLPNTGTNESELLHAFIEAINNDKPYAPTIQIIRENSQFRSLFIEKLLDDRSESSLSYFEFLQHLRTQIK